MKLLLLLIICLLFYIPSNAQSLSWFHGDWTGETYFPNGPITKRIIVKLKVTNITGNRFEALLDNFYPNDTTVRLERKITGHIINKKMKIENSEQIYIRDPRTQNFWQDCTGCEIESGFSISSDQIEIKLKTTHCSDACNGETTFSRDTSDLNPSQQKELVKWLQLPAPKLVAKKDKTPEKNSSPIISNQSSSAIKTDILQTQKATATDTIPIVQNAQAVNENAASITSPKKDSIITQYSDNTVSAPSLLPVHSPETIQKSNDALSSVPAISIRSDSEFIQEKKDTVSASASVSTQAEKDSIVKQITPKADSMPSALTSRTTNLINTYQVSSPHIVIQLFDNAEIDGDMVTVYHNGQLIVNRQSLTHKAITITIDAFKANAHHEFIMVADNLGLIPPNTALMRITAGQQKFELEVSSDFDNNSKITIDYTGE